MIASFHHMNHVIAKKILQSAAESKEPIHLYHSYYPSYLCMDGQATLMRTYTFDDIKILLSESDYQNYSWTIADATKSNGKKSDYYISGIPKKK